MEEIYYIEIVKLGDPHIKLHNPVIGRGWVEYDHALEWAAKLHDTNAHYTTHSPGVVVQGHDIVEFKVIKVYRFEKD